MSATAVASATTSAKKDSVPEIIAASMVGTAIEFYDNYCYSIASASYFGAIFFPAATKANPAIGTMLAFLTFAVSFLARPFGSMLFGHFGDKIGRKTTLVVALMTMGISTFLVGCLPSYDQLGILAIIILCVCRACQGVGLAGEWSGAALVATENAPAHKRALYGSFPNLGAPIGFFCAYGLNLLLDSTLGPDTMQAWGWRIPFLCSAVLVAIGLYVRLRMTETPIFRKAVANDRVVKHPLRSLVPYWKEVLLGTFAMGITYTLFYVLGTWSLSYGVKVMQPAFTQNEYLAMQMTSVVFFAVFILISCVYSDRIGRKKVLITTTALTLVFSLFAMNLLHQQRPHRHGVPMRRLRAHGMPVRTVRRLSAGALPDQRALLRRGPELQPRGHPRRRVRPDHRHRPGAEDRLRRVRRLVHGHHGRPRPRRAVPHQGKQGQGLRGLIRRRLSGPADSDHNLPYARLRKRTHRT